MYWKGKIVQFNKHIGWNKHLGRIILKKFNKCVGWNKHIGLETINMLGRIEVIHGKFNRYAC